jgi:hypothetical protein
MNNYEVIYDFSMDTKCSWRNIAKFLKRNRNYIRFYLIRAKTKICKVITHEQKGCNKFFRVGQLRSNLGQLTIIFGIRDNQLWINN